jgi:quercetin dioxygenase-like cupin family protein
MAGILWLSTEFLLSQQGAAMTTAAAMISDIAIAALPDDDRLWVPQMPNVWFRPLLLNTVNGEWVNLLRVTRSGVLSRHRHPAPVHGYVIRGSWRYLEHDWVAREGMYIFEPPGEVHTLVVDRDVPEMITLFHVLGAVIYYDDQMRPTGHDDVHTKLDMARRHYEQVGLGADFVDQFIR